MRVPGSATAASANILRILLVLLCVAASLLGVGLYHRSVAPDGLSGLDQFRSLLVLVSVFWLTWGSATGLFGLFYRRPPASNLADAPIAGRTAILVPVYNEDPVATFSRVAAMNASLVELEMEQHFHFAVLSDTKAPEVAALEAFWFQRLIWEQAGTGRMFYRHRTENIGKKAGNIEDFIRRSGAGYDYAVILDADSLIEGATLVEMVRRMEADPRLGLLQTLPQVVHARSVFGRAMQFAAAYYSPIFASGLSLLQGREGPFWGHNAIVRVRAFAGSCGLPVLAGRPPFGGHVLSHDYVEAALLARAGWTVRLDPDIGGSYEEGPENLIEYAKRDRRWCQGNLQHWRILFAPGLHLWNRLTLLQGIMAYLASPVWLAFLAASLIAATFQPARLVRPEVAAEASATAWTLFTAILVMLAVPKLLVVLHGMLSGGNRRYGGNTRVLLSAIAEIVFSSLVAPIMLLFQTRAVIQVLLGLDSGWPATMRNQPRLSLRDAWAASSWIVVVGVAGLLVTAVAAPHSLAWIAPSAVPMLLAPLLIALSSHGFPARGRFLFATDPERQPSPVMLERERVLRRWSIGLSPEVDPPTVELELETRLRA